MRRQGKGIREKKKRKSTGIGEKKRKEIKYEQRI